MNDNRSPYNLPVEYESIGRPSINLANSATTASSTNIKKNNIYNNEVKSYEFILSLSANAQGFNTSGTADTIDKAYFNLSKSKAFIYQ